VQLKGDLIMESFKEFLNNNRPKEVNVTIGSKEYTIYWNLEFDVMWNDSQTINFIPTLRASGMHFDQKNIKELFGVNTVEIELPEPVVKYTLSSDIDALNDQITLIESIEFISKVKEQLKLIENEFKVNRTKLY
jgi:hypothetical protein